MIRLVSLLLLTYNYDLNYGEHACINASLGHFYEHIPRKS